MINKKHINELSKIKQNRQQKLEIKLGELNKANKELRNKINAKDEELITNRDERLSNVKGFYSNAKSGKTFNAKSVYALENLLQKLDGQYNTLLEQKESLIAELELLKNETKVVQKGIKDLIIKQEKYKYLVETKVH